MGNGAPRAPPKRLAERLSKKSSSKDKASRKKSDPSKEPPPADENGEPEQTAKMEAAPLPPLKPLKVPRQLAAVTTDPCGAPAKPAQAFVPARVAPAAEGGSDGTEDLADLMTKALAGGDAAVPLRGSASNGMVPNFHCTGCDFQVLKVDNHIWANNGDVEYMFLRNNYPNVMKLRAKLEQKQGCVAYCCQCSSRSADAGADLSDVAEGLKWRVIQM
ncbi:unnamed protein product [Polarella glacialis]|uniref:Cilia- and flagella-associated protein 418 n=1 Tax=Polarella glacialis TaxID=89957 RepID=A0A813K1T9_POLGL|nr:unnamed protein product [Polarella glacialis]